MNYRHGHTINYRRSPEHQSWSEMLKRCHCKTSRAFSSYGGRGVTVCDRWLVFENFLEDMGEKPGPEYSLDRVDNNKGYSKENCRWATKKEQARNRRTSRLITYKNETRALAEWCDLLSLDYFRVSERLDLGWSAERAFSEPKHGHKGEMTVCEKCGNQIIFRTKKGIKYVPRNIGGAHNEIR